MGLMLARGGSSSPPSVSLTSLETRTRLLTSANTPVLNAHYFRSAEGSPALPNNTTTGQGEAITWQTQGVYHDPTRRRMHQLDRQHSSLALEHAYLDEATNAWVKVDATLFDGSPAGHWRAADFDPATGKIYHHREGTNYLAVYDPDSNSWGTKTNTALSITSGDPGNGGFHPNLFGAGVPGFLTGRWNTTTRFVAYNITDDTWHLLKDNPSTSIGVVLYAGLSVYLPQYDELLMMGGAGGACVAFADGAGLETDLSTSNSAEIRNSFTDKANGFDNPGAGGNNFAYGCVHPRQPNVILALDAASSAVWYTADGARTAWQLASFTHPFASELNTTGAYTVGSLPYHDVVAACETQSGNVTNFVYWKPPLV